MEKTMQYTLILGGDSHTVIAWANRGKSDKPVKLYVGDVTVSYDKVDPKVLTPVQSDSKYIFFSLELSEDGSIPEAPAPVVAEKTEEKVPETASADDEDEIEEAIEEALNPASAGMAASETGRIGV